MGWMRFATSYLSMTVDGFVKYGEPSVCSPVCSRCNFVIISDTQAVSLDVDSL